MSHSSNVAGVRVRIVGAVLIEKGACPMPIPILAGREGVAP